jgi:hypothetical protein
LKLSLKQRRLLWSVLKINADILSRYQPEKPCQEMSIYTDPKDLPCQGCAHCTTIHRSWSTFVTEIDDTVPLGKVAVKKCFVSKPLDRNHRESCVPGMASLLGLYKWTSPDMVFLVGTWPCKSLKLINQRRLLWSVLKMNSRRTTGRVV